MPSDFGRPFQILIVDDGPGDVLLIREAIEDSRFICAISVAANGAEAMEVLKGAVAKGEALPDLVLLDLNMPRMNGREVLKAMKADASLSRIPVVVLTCSDVERDVHGAYELGAQGFITKPPDVDQLFKAIHGAQNYWFAVVRSPLR